MPSKRSLPAWCFFFVVVLTVPSRATTVLQVSLARMAAGSELIFEGQVVSIEPRQIAGESMIHTSVTFEVLDVIKGSVSSRHITLDFLGGALGGRVLQVGGMLLPEMQERGIYFVEDRGQRLAHPLYGWEQGHFVIDRASDGPGRVKTRQGKNVVALDVETSLPRERLSSGVAAGVRVSRGGGEPAMTVSDFKRTVAELARRAQ